MNVPIMPATVERSSPAAAEQPGCSRTARTAGTPWRLWLGLIFVAGAFLLFYRLGEAKTLGSHEGYAVVPAREMIASGDYVVPRFGGLPRLNKPPLIYWAIVGSSELFGGLSIGAARVPAAIAGLLLAGLLARWGWRWYGWPGAIGAAAAQVSSAYVLTFARKAEADMILGLLIAAALYLIVESRADESRRAWFFRWAAVWAFASVSWMGKFHFGPAMIFAPAVAWLVIERRWRDLFGLANPLGLLLFAAAVGVWPAVVAQRLPEAWSVWQAETIGRAVGELGRQPVWYYLPHLVAWTLPWTIFAVTAWPASSRAALGSRVREGEAPAEPQASRLRGTHACDFAAHHASRAAKSQATREGCLAFVERTNRRWRDVVERGDARERFLWVWLLVTFAVVTAQPNKHPHYILPCLPAFSLWTARRIADLAARARRGERLLTRPWAVSLTVVGAAVVGLAVLAGSRIADGAPAVPFAAAVSLAMLGPVAGGWLLVYRRNAAAAACLLTCGLVAYGIATARVVPAQDHRRGAYAFAEEVRRRSGPESPVGVYGLGQDTLVYYLDEPAYRAETPRDLAPHLAGGRPVRLLTMASRLPTLDRVGEVRSVERFSDRPGYPSVELGHYREMVFVELAPIAATAERDRDRR